MTPAGVVYVAYGDRARVQCALSIKTLRAWHNNLGVVVVSDHPMADADETVIMPDLEITAREYKTRAYEFAPWDYCLYLDADTRIVGSLQGGFTALAQGWDMCLALDVTRTVNTCTHISGEEVAFTREMLGTGEAHQWNSGVIFFRKYDAVKRWYETWHTEWQRFAHADQMALVRAMHLSPVRVWPLGEPWNTHKEKMARHIFHAHHRARRDGAP